MYHFLPSRWYFKPFLIAAALFFLVTVIPSVQTGNRNDAFIGYKETELSCTDLLPDCQARKYRCLTDPYDTRVTCPLTCQIEGGGSASREGQHLAQMATFMHQQAARHHGSATRQAMQQYVEAMVQHGINPANYRRFKPLPSGDELVLSSLGMGTYLGNPDPKTDEAVTAAAIYSVSHGWNVIDTASNYRYGQAEISVGRALDALLKGPGVPHGVAAAEPAGDFSFSRDQLFISTKAGFVTREVVAQLLQEGKLSARDVVRNMHSMHPAYIQASLELSLERLHLDTVDLLYLHNAAEVQLPLLGPQGFLAAVRAAFTAMEELRQQGKIRYYGLATWECFRCPPTDPVHLTLLDVMRVAREVGGEEHGCRFMQLPINAAMPEAWLQPWQLLPDGSRASFMEAARQLGVGVFGSGPLMEAGLVSRLAGKLSAISALQRQQSDAAKLIQFARSTPGLLGSLVGHKTRQWVEQNAALALTQPLSELEFREAYQQMSA